MAVSLSWALLEGCAAAAELVLVVVVVVVPLVFGTALGPESVVVVGWGALEGGFRIRARGPVGGARSCVGREGGGRDRGCCLDDRGGVRVRVRVEACSLRGERERERRDGCSSAASKRSALFSTYS